MTISRKVVTALLLTLAIAATTPEPGRAQRRELAQDPAVDNLVHPTGYRTADAPITTRKIGRGPRSMVLIAGLGFGAEIFADFMARREAEFTMYPVTLAGFGGTPALPMPAGTTSFGGLPWTRAATNAILALLDRENVGRATLVAHWIGASQIALRLALDHPDRFDAVILIGGVAKVFYVQGGNRAMLEWTPAQHVAFADGMGQRWFKTVTRRTWDDNNFMPFDYAIHPVRALQLWRAAAEPTLPTWIRWLLEFYAQNLGPELLRLTVPTLVIRPGFDDPGFFVDGERTYMRDLCLGSWSGLEGKAPALTFATVSGARLFVMDDQPAALDRLVTGFLTAHR
ncbi:MAG: alpha/beta hydrolase [Gemmatimonadales bacterium]|nr:alpha/beta hydrolase [Gemmatimonadales bacterium]